jgi:hypothetical protein
MMRWSAERERERWMAGTPVAAGFLAQAAFWMLLIYTAVWAERRPVLIAVFVTLWVAGLVCVPRLFFDPFGTLFSSFVAILDIALVFIAFKGDIRLT